MDPSLTDTATNAGTLWMQDILQFAIILFLVALNGFFVAAEFAIVKVRKTRIEAMVDESRRAGMTMHLLNHMDAYLNATQLGITVSTILLGAVGADFVQLVVVEPLLGHIPWIGETTSTAIAFILAVAIIVFLHVVFGELAPKSVAVQNADSVSQWVAYPMRGFFFVFYPFVMFFNAVAALLLRAVGIQSASNNELSHSEEELRIILSESERSGHLTSDKMDLLEKVFDFSNVTVRQIMVPRTEVAVFDRLRPLAENLAVAERTAHSRYPVVDGDLDHVIGVIHMKDLFWQLKEMELGASDTAADRRNPMIAGGDLQSRPPSSGADFLSAIAREVLYVPETAMINTLLRDFQLKRIHMAMVVDEYGGTTGLVTFENVIEEIVGEVQDEFDQELPPIQRISDDEYILDGSTSLDELNDTLQFNFSSEEADTIGGFVLSEMGKFPKPGDKIIAENVELVVREMRRQRIHKVALRVMTPEEIAAHNESIAPVKVADETEY